MAWSRDPGQLDPVSPHTWVKGRDTQLGRHALDTEQQGTEHRRARTCRHHTLEGHAHTVQSWGTRVQRATGVGYTGASSVSLGVSRLRRTPPVPRPGAG